MCVCVDCTGVLVQYHKQTLDNVREAAAKHYLPIAIALDTKGPEIRTGVMAEVGNSFRYRSSYRSPRSFEFPIQYSLLVGWQDANSVHEGLSR